MLSTLAEAMWSSPSVCTVTATLRSSRTAHGLTPRTTPNGLYDAVKYIARLPYVDASRIGVTGHSNGALASRVAVMQDEEADRRRTAGVQRCRLQEGRSVGQHLWQP